MVISRAVEAVWTMLLKSKLESKSAVWGWMHEAGMDDGCGGDDLLEVKANFGLQNSAGNNKSARSGLAPPTLPLMAQTLHY